MTFLIGLLIGLAGGGAGGWYFAQSRYAAMLAADLAKVKATVVDIQGPKT